MVKFTMAHSSILLLSVTFGIITMTHSQGLTPFKEDFTTITEVVIPCGARCVAQKYKDLVDTATQCIMSPNGIQEEITQAVNDLNLTGVNDYQKIYGAFFKEGNTRLCSWYKTSSGCFDKGLGKLCESAVETAITKFTTDYQKLICSTTPNYLACIAHPSAIGISNPVSVPYIGCITNLNNFFTSLQPLTYDNYYQKLITDTDSFSGRLVLHQVLRTFGNCIGDAIRSLPISSSIGCTTAGDEVEKYIIDTINFLDFNRNDGKDYMRCFARPNLHTLLIQCGTSFVNALNTGTTDPFLTLEAALKEGPARVMTLYKGPYKTLSICLRGAVTAACMLDDDSEDLVNKLLLPLDHFFDGNDQDKVCGSPPTSSAHRSTTAPHHSLIVCGVLLIVSVLPWTYKN